MLLLQLASKLCKSKVTILDSRVGFGGWVFPDFGILSLVAWEFEVLRPLCEGMIDLPWWRMTYKSQACTGSV
jgi:hypothetical protein